MKKLKYMLAFILLAGMLTGCADKKETSGQRVFYHSMNEESTQTEKAAKADEELYMIAGLDTANETMRVYRYADGLEYQYHYGLSTEFLNKYGEHTSVVNFSNGDIICLSGTNTDGKVSRVQKSQSAWNYDDVTNFSINTSEGIMDIADSSYKISGDTYVFSNDSIADFDDISDNDILSVVGIDKKILAISIKTGHGTLKLKNTELFDGSFLQLGNSIFAEITSNMEMEVPEGEYTLAVANNGWGGTQDIEIERGEETVVDLSTLKGDGPKTAQILFKTDIDDAQIYIDGKQIDSSQVTDVQYGKHTLKVTADGYDDWTRTLYVNSPQSTIELNIKDDEDDSENSSTQAKAVEPEEARSSEAQIENQASSQTAGDASTNGSTSSSAAGSSSATDTSNSISSSTSTSSSGSTGSSGSKSSSGSTSSSGSKSSSGSTGSSGSKSSSGSTDTSESGSSSLVDGLTNDQLKDYLSTLSSILSSSSN